MDVTTSLAVALAVIVIFVVVAANVLIIVIDTKTTTITKASTATATSSSSPSQRGEQQLEAALREAGIGATPSSERKEEAIQRRRMHRSGICVYNKWCIFDVLRMILVDCTNFPDIPETYQCLLPRQCP